MEYRHSIIISGLHSFQARSLLFTLSLPRSAEACLLPDSHPLPLESFDKPPATADVAERVPQGIHSSCQRSSSKEGLNQAQSVCHEHSLRPSLPWSSVETRPPCSPSAASASRHTISCSRRQSAAGGLCWSVLRRACISWNQQGLNNPCPRHPSDHLGASGRGRLSAHFLPGLANLGGWDAARHFLLAMGCVL